MKKNITLGVILILIGLIWLVSNLEVFSFDIISAFFRSLATLWPLLLIGIGLSILLKESTVFKLLIWLIILVAILIYGIYNANHEGYNYQYIPQTDKLTEAHDYSISKEAETVEGRLNLNLGAGEVYLSSTDTNLLQLKSNIPNLTYDHSFQNGLKKAVIDCSEPGMPFKDKWPKSYCYLDLHEDVIWDLDLNLGAANSKVDFSNLAVKHLALEAGAVNLDLFLGNKTKDGDISLYAGASNVTIYAPKEAGLKVRLNSALASNNISDLALEKHGEFYISPSFEEKENKYNLNIDMAAGNLTFRVQ